MRVSAQTVSTVPLESVKEVRSINLLTLQLYSEGYNAPHFDEQFLQGWGISPLR